MDKNKRKQFECLFCGWTWFSNKNVRTEPKVCPKCHNNWRKSKTENETRM